VEASVLRIEKFKDVSLADPFFDTLKADYPGFPDWFASKADREAFTFVVEGGGQYC
jgi:hypothetical protein